MIQGVEGFGHRFQAHALAEREGAAERALTLKKSLPVPTLRPMKAPFTIGRAAGPLDGGGAGRDVQRQRGVVLQHAAQLKAVSCGTAPSNTTRWRWSSSLRP